MAKTRAVRERGAGDTKSQKVLRDMQETHKLVASPEVKRYYTGLRVTFLIFVFAVVVTSMYMLSGRFFLATLARKPLSEASDVWWIKTVETTGLAVLALLVVLLLIYALTWLHDYFSPHFV